jgi:hypothetical protein
MSAYPREVTGADISPALAKLVREIAERMLTGVGLFAYFNHSPETEPVSRLELTVGDVPMDVPGLQAGAGSLLKISGGRLELVEIYTFGEPWPDEPPRISFGEATPLPIPSGAI